MTYQFNGILAESGRDVLLEEFKVHAPPLTRICLLCCQQNLLTLDAPTASNFTEKTG
jgi:hypothetical protein